MKIKFAILLLIVTVSTMTLAQAGGATVEVCKVAGVPSGFVVVGVTTTEQCRSFIDLPERDNTYLVKRPGPREVVCEQSPFPGNYAVTGRSRLLTCPNGENEAYNNAWIIELLK